MAHSVPSQRCLQTASSKVELFDEPYALPCVDDLLTERKVLSQAYRAVELGGSIEGLRQDALDLLQSRGVFLPTGEANLVSGALAYISHQSVGSFLFPIDSGISWIGQLTQRISKVWLLWADGQSGEALKLLSSIRTSQPTQELVSQQSGAIDLWVRYLWLSAIEALIQGDLVISVCQWRRAIEVSGQFGTDSHSLITWSFSASFVSNRF